MKRSWYLLVVAICVAFGLRVLLLIDATSLWSDELYSVGKSFQPSFSALLTMLRDDTHPPGYYALLWVWGHLVGQTPVTLRLLSWLAYLAGGLVMIRQAVALGHARPTVAPVAALLAFCSAYPIRFAIEGKSYAVLVLLLALAWWWRRSGHPIAYGAVAGLAGLTHFYGLFLVLATAAWDGWKQRWSLACAAMVGALPSLAWMTYASEYLFSSRAGSWIGGPDFALFEDTLARGIGVWPLPKLGLILLLVIVLKRWGGLRGWRWPEAALLDRSGLTPSLLMVVGVVTVSFVKPMTFSRYFVVLLPAVVPVLAVFITQFKLNTIGRNCSIAVLSLLLISWWGQSFSELDSGESRIREDDQFSLISQQTRGQMHRFSSRSKLLNLSDTMEASMGRISHKQTKWNDEKDLAQLLSQTSKPDQLWLAESGPPKSSEEKLVSMLQLTVKNGYQCEKRSRSTNALILECERIRQADEEIRTLDPLLGKEMLYH